MSFARALGVRLGLVIALAAAACGGDDGGGEITIDNYSEAVRDAQCKVLVQCGEISDLDTCRKAHLPGDPNTLSVSELAAVTMKLAAYDAKQAASCVDALSQRGCDSTSESARALPAPCLAVFAGTVHDGGACAQDVECISLTCSAPTTCDAACCVGTCAGDAAPGFAAVGEPCGGASQCDAATAYCDQVALICAPFKPAGALCEASTECAYGLDCSPAGACAALPKLGDACTGACRDNGTTCNATSQTCVRVGLEGAACNTSADCSPLYQCSSNKQCTAGVALGQACTLTTPCAGRGTVCDVPDGETQGTCVTAKAAGATCTLDADCQSDFCDPHTLTCQPQTVCVGSSG
jgi:hypothetical protein